MSDPAGAPFRRTTSNTLHFHALSTAGKNTYVQHTSTPYQQLERTPMSNTQLFDNSQILLTTFLPFNHSLIHAFKNLRFSHSFYPFQTHLKPSQRVFPCDLAYRICSKKSLETRQCKYRMFIRSFVSKQYQHVTDRWTDEYTSHQR